MDKKAKQQQQQQFSQKYSLLHSFQVVWKATTELGLATAVTGSKKFLFVARYKVRGNFGNKQAYIDNVKPKGNNQH